MVTMPSPGDSTLRQSSRAPKVGFGPFEFDPASGELRKHGYKVKLPGQPGEILSELITRPGEVLTREDLRVRRCGVGAGPAAMAAATRSLGRRGRRSGRACGILACRSAFASFLKGGSVSGFPTKGVLPRSGWCPAVLRFVSGWRTDRLYGQ